MSSPARYVTHADIGGRSTDQRIAQEPEDERFHAAWERQAFALTLAMGATGAWNIDMSRSAREQLPRYDELSYYAIWFEALERLLLERGLVTPQELALGRPITPEKTGLRVPRAVDIGPALRRGAPTERVAQAPARFAVGDQVVTRAAAVPHHTRLPGYAWGRRGVVERVHGVHVFADAHAQGLGEQPQWLYAVGFDGAELWQGSGTATRVSLDLWESYLEPQPGQVSGSATAQQPDGAVAAVGKPPGDASPA